jgi:hypothetical protein
MAAPTPVSAYLHSATMVKAGVFLLARLYPVLGFSVLFEYVVTTVGLTTLVFAAYVAVFKHDLKGLLAYSTISHLGLITFLLGLDSPLSALAAVFHVLNHATFKASLFMAAGIIDHESGHARHAPPVGPVAFHALHGDARDHRGRGDGRRAAAERLPLQGDVLRRGARARPPGLIGEIAPFAVTRRAFSVAYSRASSTTSSSTASPGPAAQRRTSRRAG